MVGSGSTRQLALQKRSEILVVLERVGPAPARSQRAHDQTVRVLAQTADGYGPVGGAECLLVVASLKLLLAQLDHGIERQALPDAGAGQRAIRSRPPPGSRFRPVDGPCRGRPRHSGRPRLPSPTSASNSRHVARDHVGPERNRFAMADERIFAQHAAKPGEGLAQVLPSLGVEVRAPQQGHQLVAAVRLRGRAGQKRKQGGQLLAGQIDDGPIRPAQLEAAEQRKLKSGLWHSVHTRPKAETGQCTLFAPAFCNFHGPPSKNSRPCHG